MYKIRVNIIQKFIYRKRWLRNTMKLNTANFNKALLAVICDSTWYIKIDSIKHLVMRLNNTGLYPTKAEAISYPPHPNRYSEHPVFEPQDIKFVTLGWKTLNFLHHKHTHTHTHTHTQHKNVRLISVPLMHLHGKTFMHRMSCLGW